MKQEARIEAEIQQYKGAEPLLSGLEVFWEEAFRVLRIETFSGFFCAPRIAGY